MQREGYDAVARAIRFMIAVKQLDVDVLIERSGNAITGSWKYAPSPPGLGSEDDSGVVGRVAQTE